MIKKIDKQHEEMIFLRTEKIRIPDDTNNLQEKNDKNDSKLKEQEKNFFNYHILWKIPW